jgi:hypothetical protein
MKRTYCQFFWVSTLLAWLTVPLAGAAAEPPSPRPACTDQERAALSKTDRAPVPPAACNLVLTTEARRPAPAPPRRAAAASCSPACRAGYFCVKGSCVSPCNPGCEAGEICAATGECVARNPAPAPAVVAITAAPPPPAPEPPPVFQATSGLGLGFRFSLLGTVQGSDAEGSDQMEPAYGFSPFIDVAVGRLVMLGAGATLSFNVRPFSERAPARKFDLVARIAGVVPLGQKLRLFGRFSPGYSRIILLSSQANRTQNPYGFVLGFEGGADILLTPGIFVTAGVAYDAGFHSQRLAFRARDSQTRYLQLFGALGLTL